MENTIEKRLVMRVRLQDVSDRSSAIEYVGQGTWFDGKSFIVTQYKANPSNFYFFVYDSFVPEYNYFGGMDKGFGNEIWNLNPENGQFSGKTYVYSTMTQHLYSPYGISPVVKSPAFIFEMK